MDARTDARTDNVKTVYPLQTKFAGGNHLLAVKRLQNIALILFVSFDEYTVEFMQYIHQVPCGILKTSRFALSF